MTEPTAFVLTHESNPDRNTNANSMQALAITRSLGRRGVRVVRVHPNRYERSLLSRYCSGVEICPNVHGSEDALLQFLLDLGRKYDGPRVLLPASDDTAFFLGRFREPLLKVFQIPAASKSTIEKIINKRLQYEAAQQLSIPIPETYFPHSVEEVRNLAGVLRGYPYVIKPNVAHHWRLSSVKQQMSSAKGAPTKGVAVQTPEQLVAEYERLCRGDPDLMVQEIISGRDELLYTFLGYFNQHSQPLGYCVRSKIRQYPLRFGYCTLTVSCENETVVDQSIRLLQSLNYHGIVGVEWKHDPKTGQYKLIEINARAVNTTALAPACGVDLPYIAFADAIGETVTPVTRWTSGVKWIWFTQDMWAARELYRRKELTLRDWWRSIKGTRVHGIYARDDLRPVADYLRKFVKVQVLKLLRRLWRRPTQAGSSSQL